MSLERLRADALEIFRASVRAADPAGAVKTALDADRRAGEGAFAATGRLRLIAFGKAACAMAEAAVQELGPQLSAQDGLVVTSPENARPVPPLEVLPTSHPMPSAAGAEAARRVVDLVSGARAEDLLLVLVSGGGSAILPAPTEGLSLEDKVVTTRLLLGSGATIQEVNAVRKHLSRLKGGGLARLAWPARVDALLLSDVVGDDLSVIASGPTAPDPSTFAECREILQRRDLLPSIPAVVRDRIDAGCRGEIEETPKPGATCFERVRHRLVGSNGRSLDAASEVARSLGYAAEIASRELVGEAREVGRALAERLVEFQCRSGPRAVLAGGETTVTVRGNGQGGRNQELALAFASSAPAAERSWAFLSAGTDGIDGPTDAAGALVDSDTASRARRSGVDLAAHLANNDAYHALEAVGDLLRTGATGTNVADLQILLVE